MKSSFCKTKLLKLVALIGLVTVVTSSALASDLVCLYTLANYQGGKFCFSPGQRPPNLDAFPLSDGTYTNGSFGSIKVEGNAVGTIYSEENYESSIDPLYVSTSIADLQKVWGATIFSLDVEYPSN